MSSSFCDPYALLTYQLTFPYRMLQNTTDGDNTVTDSVVICCPYKGILIYMLGAFCMALGVNLQKYSINKEQLKHKDPENRRPLWKQPAWMFGMVTYGSSGGLLSLALAFAKQSQLAPLMSVVIVSNALLARFLLFEPVSKRDMAAIVIIVCAVILSTIFAPQSENTLQTTEGLIALYKEPGFIAFVIILLTLMFTFYVGNRYIFAKIDPEPPAASKWIMKMNPYRKKNKRRLERISKKVNGGVELLRNSSVITLKKKTRAEKESRSPSGETFELAFEKESPPKPPPKVRKFKKNSQFEDDDVEANGTEKDNSSGEEDSFVQFVSKFEENFFAFSFGGQAGLWGGLCVTMMKSAITIIIDEFNNNSIVGIFTNPLMYALLAVLVCCWTMQLYWINSGLERYPAVFIVSIEAVLNELIAVCGGILYFKEYLDFTPLTSVMFSTGLLFGVGGIMLFATRDNYNLKDDFFSCCPIDENYIVDEENDPRVHEKPVDEATRVASFRRSSITANAKALEKIREQARLHDEAEAAKANHRRFDETKLTPTEFKEDPETDAPEVEVVVAKDDVADTDATKKESRSFQSPSL